MDWRKIIGDAVRDHGGLATRQQLLERVPRQVLDSYVGRRHLVRIFPRVYRLRDGGEDDVTTLRAALLHAGPATALSPQPSALSHTTALAVWGLRTLDRPLHLTVDQNVKRAGAPGLLVHRRLRFDPKSTQCVQRREAHGVLNVFRHRSLPASAGQYQVQLPTHRIKLDRAWPEVKVAVELDGAQHHTSPADRRNDLARDRELAALGWVVLRFTYADVLRDPEGVRAKVLAVYRARLEKLQVG